MRLIYQKLLMMMSVILLSFSGCISIATNKDNETYDVIIIGAGMAGITAGNHLKTLNPDHNFLIFEAQDNIGGRLQSTDELGGMVELGARWIHGCGSYDNLNPICRLAWYYGYDKEEYPIDKETVLYDYNGVRFPADETERLMNEQERFVDVVLPDFRRRYPSSNVEQVMPIYKEEITRKEGQRFWVATRYLLSDHELTYGSDFSGQALAYFDPDHENFAPGDEVINAGYQPLLNDYAENIQQHIRTNYVVTRINYTREGVTVSVKDHGDFHAKTVISTLPLGVLKKGSVQFEPALPEEKQIAIGRLKTAILNWVHLRFEQPFWDEGVFIGSSPRSDKNFEKIFLLDSSGINGAPILSAMVGASTGIEFEQLSDKAAVERLMKFVRGIYGDDIPEPIGYTMSRWGQNPYASGAFSYLPIGAMPSHYKVLAEPVANKLFFAGEATDFEYQGTVHAAYFSGVRAAEEANTVLR